MTPPPQPEQTVFVIDDDPGIRITLFALLRSVHLPVETYASAQQFLDRYPSSRPGCLVLDPRLPGMSGLELQAYLASRGDCLPIIFITGHGDVPTAVAALRAGAMDFMEKPVQGQVLLDGIRQALARDTRLREAQVRHAETAARLGLLSAGERGVLDLMVAGMPNKAIAKELRISYKTVEARRARIMKKMQTETLAELLQRVLSYNLGLAPDGGKE